MSGDGAPGRGTSKAKGWAGAHLARQRTTGEARGQGEEESECRRSHTRQGLVGTRWGFWLSLWVTWEPREGFSTECDVTPPSAGPLGQQKH